MFAGSLLGPEGVFYSIETVAEMSRQFKHFHLNKYDCTQDKGWWLNKTDIDDFVNMWGRNHPLVQSSVYGEFGNEVEDAVISLTDIERNIKNPCPWIRGKADMLCWTSQRWSRECHRFQVMEIRLV